MKAEFSLLRDRLNFYSWMLILLSLLSSVGFLILFLVGSTFFLDFQLRQDMQGSMVELEVIKNMKTEGSVEMPNVLLDLEIRTREARLATMQMGIDELDAGIGKTIDEFRKFPMPVWMVWSILGAAFLMVLVNTTSHLLQWHAVYEANQLREDRKYPKTS
jgi:hypothetical protein